MTLPLLLGLLGLRTFQNAYGSVHCVTKDLKMHKLSNHIQTYDVLLWQ